MRAQPFAAPRRPPTCRVAYNGTAAIDDVFGGAVRWKVLGRASARRWQAGSLRIMAARFSIRVRRARRAY